MEKTCIKCGVLKPLDAFHRDRNTRKNTCASCIREYGTQYRAMLKLRNPPLEKVVCPAGTWFCKQCLTMKPLEEFKLDRRMTSGRQNQCYSCRNAWYRHYRRKLGEDGKAKARATAKRRASTVCGRVRRMVWQAKKRAKQCGIDFSLKPDDIVVPPVCPVLGTPFVISGCLNDNSMSLDRVIPTLGYIPENVRIISFKANRLKNNATVEELEKILSYVKEHKCAFGI